MFSLRIFPKSTACELIHFPQTVPVNSVALIIRLSRLRASNRTSFFHHRPELADHTCTTPPSFSVFSCVIRACAAQFTPGRSPGYRLLSINAGARLIYGPVQRSNRALHKWGLLERLTC